MELRVNDYVRTKKGIAKIIDRINDPTNYFDKFWVCDRYLELNDDTEYIHEQDVAKCSSNIIDLIEVGDLIRIEYYSLRYEERVTRLFEVTYKDKKNINLNNSKCDFMLIDGDFNKSDKKLDPIIKSIVTKEQISQMEYKIGDEYRQAVGF